METNLFHFDMLAALMAGLIGFIGLCVAVFSLRYLKGDRASGRFFTTLGAMIGSLFVLVCADHIVLFLGAWAAANLLLVRLMIHKAEWTAARASGRLAFQFLSFGFACILGGFILLAMHSGEMTVQGLLGATYDPLILTGSLTLIAIGAAVQCGLWPFQNWLLSSLNSPTPTSAIMHAGLVNGGGFLLVRLAPLYVQIPNLLMALFVIGLAAAIVGTLWKLMQSDVKRMLACSTMGQMGFMVVQCGLGLFPAAIAHLCWHGMFKAYLFLASGAAAQEKRLPVASAPSLAVFTLSLLCGIGGMAAFIGAARIDALAMDTTLFLSGMAFIAGTQLAISMLQKPSFTTLAFAAFATAAIGALYGFSVEAFKALLAPMELMQPQPLNALHIAGFIAMALCWLAMLFARGMAPAKNGTPRWLLRGYTEMLNASQPHPATITAIRNEYRY